MNRAQRRSLKRVVAHAIKGKPGLLHPVPDSVVLHGGPMASWIVKPNAPALEPDWRAKYLEAEAEGEFLKWQRAEHPELKIAWNAIDESTRWGFREAVRVRLGAGHYQLAPDGKTAAWVAE